MESRKIVVKNLEYEREREREEITVAKENR